MKENQRNGFIIMLYAFLLGSILIGTCQGKLPKPFQKRRVRVENGLSYRNLSVHCKSKDDDLNTQVLAPGMFFAWKFKINFDSSTLYWCNLWWEFAHKSFVAFDANSFEDDTCGPNNTCWWNTNEYGVTMFDAKDGAWVHMYDWDRSHS